MSTYTFRVSTMPLVTLSEDQCGHVMYELSYQHRAIARWGGVIDSAIATSLKPWARPVRLDFNGYRLGNRDWVDLEIGQGLWGCLLDGPARGQFVAFVVLDQGIPVPTKVDSRWVPKPKQRA